MKFKIEKEVFNRFPDLIVAIPVIMGFDNTKGEIESLSFLRKEEKSLQQKFKLEDFYNDTRVSSYLDIFRKFGADPDKRMPAHVALSKRVMEGGNLPDINPIVNFYNALSIKYMTPFGGEDLDTLYGNFVLQFARGNEKWIGIGATKPKTMFKGDLIWKDDLDVSTPSLNWRQCDRTKLTPSSKNGYFIMDGFSDVNRENIEKAANEFVKITTNLFGGKAKIYLLDINNPEIEIPFKSKKLENLKVKKIIKNEKQKVKKEYIGIQKEIANKLFEITGVEEIIIDFPRSEQFGDYTTNIAWRYSKIIGSRPQEAAENIKNRFMSKYIDKVDVAKDGFINFWLKKDILIDNLTQISKQKDDFGKNDVLKGKKIMFEYAHPNTHKAFHIGHLRNITTGETLSRLHEAIGANVIRANYQGDIGLHIAKAVYGIEISGFTDPKDIKKRAEYLGKVYAKGATAYEENEKAKERVGEINLKIYDKSDPKINKLYEETRKWSLDYFGEIYKRVYTKFDRLYFESECAESGKKTALEALKKGILEESDGAIIFRGSKHGLHDRVFISGKGVPTYEGKDLGLAKLQFKEFDPDLLIHTVGPEQAEYFKVIFKALEFILPETKGREAHVPYGWVKLKEGKMSSRTGNVILGEDILDQAKEKILESYKIDRETAEKVAVGAVKYSFLKTGLAHEIAFDLNESISLEGNSGPYIQYTYARTQSVLQKATYKVRNLTDLQVPNLQSEENEILRKLSQFSEVIIDAAKSYSPNLVCNYLYDLASKFNTFYQKHKIIGNENEAFRVFLTSGVGQVLKNGLKLLGIESPERM